MTFKVSYILPFLLLALLLPLALTAKTSCEYQQNPWQRGKSFQISEREDLVSTIYNVDIIIDRYDALVSSYIRNSGSWEAFNIRTMTRFVNEGSAVLNIGSHVGLQAMIMGKIIGKTGRLFIMEPFSITHNMVLKNVYFNGLGDITTVYKVGASNKYSKGYIAVSNSNTGGSEIFTDQTIARPSVKSQEVEVDRVDDILPKDAVIDFALIDVERSQVECLEGMKETILRSPNIVIMCEWAGYSNNSRDIKKKISDLINWFASLKFKFYRTWARPPNCTPQVFTEVSVDYVISMPDPVDRGGFPDIFIIPGHIDPNKTF